LNKKNADRCLIHAIILHPAELATEINSVEMPLGKMMAMSEDDSSGLHGDVVQTEIVISRF